MSASRPKQGKPGTKRVRRRAAEPAVSAAPAPKVRALGNDPFERGAAVRPRAPAAAPQLPSPAADASPPPAADAVPCAADASPALAASAAGVAPAPATAGASVTAEAEATAPRSPEDRGGQRAEVEPLVEGEPSPSLSLELRRTLARLWPALRERLGQLETLRALLAGTGEVDAFGFDRALDERISPLVEFLFGSWWRVEARGLEDVPSEGPLVLVANHGGALPWDALVLRAALARHHPARRELRPLLDARALGARCSGRLAARLGAVPATPENALRILGAGGAVAVFPEGSGNAARPWSERYRIEHFGKGGFARLALRTGAAVVPCAIVGSEEASAPLARAGWFSGALGLSSSSMPLLELALALVGGASPLGALELFPLPSRWSLRFGPPVDAGEPGALADDPARVQALAGATRLALQRMLAEDLAARRSVYL